MERWIDWGIEDIKKDLKHACWNEIAPPLLRGLDVEEAVRSQVNRLKIGVSYLFHCLFFLDIKFMFFCFFVILILLKNKNINDTQVIFAYKKGR